MRVLGLIGGTSWHSTLEYYRFINQSVNERFSDNTTPPLVLCNLNHSEVRRCQKDDDWDGVFRLVLEAATRLQAAGAEALALCANTPHKVAPKLAMHIDLPLLHIADATAREILKQKLHKIAFIGTKFSMTEDFITSKLASHGVEPLVPEDANAVEELHRIIHEELTFGRVELASKQFVLEVLERMLGLGAQGVVLGCTEFTHMIGQTDLAVPVFDTATIHARAAVDFILAQDSGEV